MQIKLNWAYGAGVSLASLTIRFQKELLSLNCRFSLFLSVVPIFSFLFVQITISSSSLSASSVQVTCSFLFFLSWGALISFHLFFLLLFVVWEFGFLFVFFLFVCFSPLLLLVHFKLVKKKKNPIHCSICLFFSLDFSFLFLSSSVSKKSSFSSSFNVRSFLLLKHLLHAILHEYIKYIPCQIDI